MAMTAQVKAEFVEHQITKTCCRKAEVATMLRFAGGLHIVSGRIVVEAGSTPEPPPDASARTSPRSTATPPTS